MNLLNTRLSQTGLHRREERVKRVFRDQIAEAAALLEIVLSGIVLVALLISIVPLVRCIPELFVDGDGVEIYDFLTRALDIVIGIEFIKMLAKHSPGSALEVLLYAIARQMILAHESALESFISVASIGLIFLIRRFVFVPSFGSTMPDGQPAPDTEPNPHEGDETFA